MVDVFSRKLSRCNAFAERQRGPRDTPKCSRSPISVNVVDVTVDIHENAWQLTLRAFKRLCLALSSFYIINVSVGVGGGQQT